MKGNELNSSTFAPNNPSIKNFSIFTQQLTIETNNFNHITNNFKFFQRNYFVSFHYNNIKTIDQYLDFTRYKIDNFSKIVTATNVDLCIRIIYWYMQRILNKK